MKPETEREAEAQLAAERSLRDLNPERRWEYTVVRLGPSARRRPAERARPEGWQLVQVIEVDGHLAFYMEREVVSEDAEAGSNGSSQGD